MKSLAAVSAVLFLLDCARVGRARTPADDLAQLSVVGTWDVAMNLDHPYQLERSEPNRRLICGTVAFVGGEAITRTGISEVLAAPGVYQLPLRQLGLEWKQQPEFPTATALAIPLESGGSELDSVRVVLNPEADEQIVLGGRLFHEVITGRWEARSERGSAEGRFTLRRRDDHSARLHAECRH